jgi:cephalosporin hydroxylase
MPKPPFRVKRYTHSKYKFLVRGKVLGKWKRRYFLTEREAIKFAELQNNKGQRKNSSGPLPQTAGSTRAATPTRGARSLSTTDFSKLVTPTYLGPRIQRYLGDSWSMHLPFAYELMREVAPKVFVELGVKQGESYFSFCQSAAENNINVRCYGVDSWRGDLQTGKLDPEIQREVAEYNWQYSSFSELKAMLFAEALEDFPDATIDLLHIDGSHIYDDVKTDFASWLPKLTANGIILFHDVILRDRGFGVWKLWDEIAREDNSFLFEFGYGLGVWKNQAVGASDSAFIRRFLGASKTERREINAYYANAGAALALWQSLQKQAGAASEAMRFKTENEERTKQVLHFQRDSEERAKHIAILQQENEEKARQVAAFQRDGEERAKHIGILQKENEEKTKQVLHVQGHAEEQAKHIGILQQENDEKKRQVIHFQGEAVEKAQRLAEVKRESEERERQLAQADEAKSRQLAQAQSENEIKSRRLAVLQRRNELKARRVSELKERVQQQLQQIAQLERANEQATRDLERLAAQSDRTDERLKHSSAELDEVRSELRAVLADKEKAVTEIEELQHRLELTNEQLKHGASELTDARWETLTLRADLLCRIELAEASREPLIHLQDQLEATLSERDQLRGMNMALQIDLEQERSNMAAQREELAASAGEASQREEHWAEKLTASEQRIRELEGQLFLAEEQSRGMQEKAVSVKNRFAALVEQLHATQELLTLTREHLRGTAKDLVKQRGQMSILRQNVARRLILPFGKSQRKIEELTREL